MPSTLFLPRPYFRHNQAAWNKWLNFFTVAHGSIKNYKLQQQQQQPQINTLKSGHNTMVVLVICSNPDLLPQVSWYDFLCRVREGGCGGYVGGYELSVGDYNLWRYLSLYYSMCTHTYKHNYIFMVYRCVCVSVSVCLCAYISVLSIYSEALKC